MLNSHLKLEINDNDKKSKAVIKPRFFLQPTTITQRDLVTRVNYLARIQELPVNTGTLRLLMFLTIHLALRTLIQTIAVTHRLVVERHGVTQRIRTTDGSIAL